MIMKDTHYIIHDPNISRSRKILTVEQFRNTELKVLQTKRSYTVVRRYFTGFMRFLSRQRKLIENDATRKSWRLSFASRYQYG